jgi:hypothetical protein
VDPDHIDADPDADPYSTNHPDTDPEADPDFYLMRIRIRLFTLMRIRIMIQNKGSNPWSAKMAQIPYILACNLQIDADPDPVPYPAYHFDADPDPEFYLMQMRIQVTKMIRIHNTGKLTNLACLSLLYSILAGEGGRSTNISWTMSPMATLKWKYKSLLSF